jgi:peroxiredoxin Q/BCP
MKQWLSYLTFAVAFGFITLLVGNSMSSAAELQPGDQAPDFSLQGSDGKTYKLSDLKGKTVVVAWFPKAFTGGCTKECKAFKEDGAEMRKFDVVYFTASVDQPEDNKKFAEQLEIDYAILSDPTKETAKAYGVIPEGKTNAARWTYYIGPDGKIKFVDKSVKPESSAKDVAAKLQELGVAAKKS